MTNNDPELVTSGIEDGMNDTAREAQLTALMADAPKADDHDGVRDYLHDLAAAGCAPLLIKPGTKEPFDGRTSRKRTAEDKAAREEAKAAGRKNWIKARSPSGVHLASNDPAVLDGYLAEYIRIFKDDVEVNVAFSVGRSRLVVVDCDTADQVAAFLADAGAPSDTAPTVESPGQRDAVGAMVHKDGGHFWFTVPECVDLPEGADSLTDPDGGYSIMWGPGRYILLPPSVRPEGPYKVPEDGEVYELPDWLRDKIIEHGRGRAERANRSTHRDGADDPIAQWGASTSWSQILADTNWTATVKTDACGCEIWTAPGEHASEKSATAHEPGCAVFADSPDPPLHIWTDHDIEPFGEHGPNVTRLRAYAAIHHGGDIGAAMTDLDLHGGPVSFGDGRSGDEVGENLPDSFWPSRPVLAHIRAAAHYRVDSADAVLGAVLARVSAHLDPAVTVDTGIKQPMPLNMFVGLVGSAGTGKTSAYSAARVLLDCSAEGSRDDPMLGTVEQPPVEMTPTTGPGIAEAFMGTVIDVDGTSSKPRRRQVRHKLLMHSDEGAGLVASILDTKAAIRLGPTLRTAWSGDPLSDGNASAERKRYVQDYVVGLCVGFQLEALAALSTAEQLEYGMPQRFLYLSAADPAIPDVSPDDPGTLVARLPDRPLRYCDELMARTRREALARARGQDTADPMQAHRPAMTARLAALLVVLCDPGRDVIEVEDVELAETLLGTSTALHSRAIEHRREREAAERERQASERISEAVATRAAVDNTNSTLEQLGKRILRYLAEAGGSAAWRGRDGLRQKFKSDERQLADSALARLGDDGQVVIDGATVRIP